MTDIHRKVNPGDPLRIPARTYNAFIDAAVDLQRRSQARQSSEQPRQHIPTDAYLGIVQVRNDSSADRSRFHVLGIEEPVFTPADNLDSFRNRMVLKAVTPTSGHTGQFAVLLEPVAVGAIANACALGVCPVRVQVSSADHAFADVSPNQVDRLQSAESGSASILWKEDGTGLKWAIVRLTNPSGAGGGLPPGNGQYKVLQLSADNPGVPHWEWVRAHS